MRTKAEQAANGSKLGPAGEMLADAHTGRNGSHALVGLFRLKKIIYGGCCRNHRHCTWLHD
jgi:hypothetical protein